MQKTQIADKDMMFSRRDVRKILIPLFFETLLSVTVGIADTMMVARAGETAVSGVSCFNTIQNLLLALFAAFGTGGAVVIGQLLGMGNKKRACFAAKQLIYLTTVISVVLGALFIGIRNPLLHLIYGTIEEEVFLNASIYALPILISLPFLAAMNSLNALFRSMGRTKITMQVSILANIVNIVGNAVCILVFHMGALGVGIATLVSRVVSVIILTVRITDKELPVHIEKFL
ncbi:MAG: polysaccharide biosynthesis C-terminal domain-containing protein, partial [Spirochaetales bacterium]|nr:polysaccharide biosynthesis C-terminal domain-containing protein [Candidatus Physcosoma equi]